jgi:hypothetical protein
MPFKNTPTYTRPPAQKQAWYDSRGNYGLANQVQDRQDYYLRRNLHRNFRRILRRDTGC